MYAKRWELTTEVTVHLARIWLGTIRSSAISRTGAADRTTSVRLIRASLAIGLACGR